jgi:stringent starvation protein B
MIQFAARFAGVSRECSIPVAAVQGIFAKENSQGLNFQPAPSPDAPAEAAPTPPAPGGKPRLQIVK